MTQRYIKENDFYSIKGKQMVITGTLNNSEMNSIERSIKERDN